MSRPRKVPEENGDAVESADDTVRVSTGEPVESFAAGLQLESDAERAAVLPELPQEPAKEEKRGPGRPRGSGGRRRRRSSARSPRRRAGSSRARDAADTVAAMAPETDPAAELREQANAIAPVLHGVLRLVIDRRFPDAPYTLPEAQALAQAAIPVAEKYGNGVLAEYLPELILASVVIVQFGGRAAASSGPAHLPAPTGADLDAFRPAWPPSRLAEPADIPAAGSP
jgi:hypothetical protein